MDNDGNVIGIDDIDETYTRFKNGIRDAVQPDVTMFVRYVLQDNNVIRIETGADRRERSVLWISKTADSAGWI